MMKKIKDLEKASKRIVKAIKKKERIVLFGDADLDGLASVIILKEAITSLNGNISFAYFPDRQKEGYGLNRKALAFLKKYSPCLLVVLDCGISNFKEAELAKEKGFELIVIDHHEIIEKLPKAYAVVDPKQEKDEYPFKKFATAGLAFYLAREMFGRSFSKKLRQSLLELAALATISDMMPREKDNEEIISRGIADIKNTLRPGLRILLRRIDEDLSIPETSQKLISILNFSEVISHVIESYKLLTAQDEKSADKVAESIIEKNKKRQERVKEIFNQVCLRVPESSKELIVFEAAKDWEIILLGSVASKVCQRYKKPTFLLRKSDKESRGAVRMPSGTNGVEAMKACSHYLETFGGHPLAAGFSLKAKNISKFKTCLVEYFEKI